MVAVGQNSEASPPLHLAPNDNEFIPREVLIFIYLKNLFPTFRPYKGAPQAARNTKRYNSTSLKD